MVENDDNRQSPAAPPRVPPPRAAEPAAEPLGSALDLKALVDGLVYPSEDDRPFDVIDWPTGPLEKHLPANAKRLTADAFFEPLQDVTDAERFTALHRALAAKLTDLAAFRAFDGSAEVSIYILGRARDGRWAGVHTTSVET